MGRSKEAANQIKQASQTDEKRRAKEQARQQANQALFISQTFIRYESSVSTRLNTGQDAEAARCFSVLIKLDAEEIVDQNGLEAYLNSPDFQVDATANLLFLQQKRKLFIRKLDTMKKKNQTLTPRSFH